MVKNVKYTMQRCPICGRLTAYKSSHTGLLSCNYRYCGYEQEESERISNYFVYTKGKKHV